MLTGIALGSSLGASANRDVGRLRYNEWGRQPVIGSSRAHPSLVYIDVVHSHIKHWLLLSSFGPFVLNRSHLGSVIGLYVPEQRVLGTSTIASCIARTQPERSERGIGD